MIDAFRQVLQSGRIRVGAGERTRVLQWIEGRAFDADAVRRIAGRESRRPAAPARERWHGHAGRADAPELALDVVDAEADVVQPVAVGIEPRRSPSSGAGSRPASRPDASETAMSTGLPDPLNPALGWLSKGVLVSVGGRRPP